MNACSVCGAPTKGLRCQACHFKAEERAAAERAAETDRLLVDLVDGQGWTMTQVGERLGVSKQRASFVVKRARARLAGAAARAEYFS